MKSSNAEFLKKMFENLKSGAEFYKMGPLLLQIPKNRRDIDISKSDLTDAFDLTIKYRLQDGNIDEALKYFVWSFGVDGITVSKRKEFAKMVFNFLVENEEDLVSKDWEDIAEVLNKQINYLKVYSKNETLLAILRNLEDRIRFKQRFSSSREEGPMREYIKELTNLYYKNIPDEEAADYAAQIILNSKP